MHLTYVTTIMNILIPYTLLCGNIINMIIIRL